MRRFYLLITCLILVFLAGSCASSEGMPPDEGVALTKILEQGGEMDRSEVRLYFRNNNYTDRDDEPTPVIPVVRLVERDKLSAREVLNALLEGPLEVEQDRFDLGPVINGAEVQVDDIYIKNGICVVHLSSPHRLPLYDYEGQTDFQAELVFTQSLLYSLTDLPSIDAAWLFFNGAPWKSDNLDWLCPLAPEGRGQSCTLYFCTDSLSHRAGTGSDSLAPVQVKLISSGKMDEGNCLFAKLMDLLSQDYDPLHRAPLPRESRVLGFSLIDGQLNVDLAAPFPAPPGRVGILMRALVYTFTGLPEINCITVTVEGRPLECGGVVWDKPLGRDDLKE